MTTRPDAGRPGTSGPVLAGILSMASAEDVLRQAFDEAQIRSVSLLVLFAGLRPGDEADLSDLVTRWAGKHPDVPVSVTVRNAVDPAIAMTAATRCCCLAVLARPADARATAVVRAVARRAGCPLTTA
ncbi:hypothetical protein [Paractinoplanes globisporus]|uniref:Uncharacterized protein n=1 Tax=Paractinoplanes globisporus TaxID=113565 RepID=A0ABW6WBZ6_9ACTN|nr:hypothetical protein [Actinoplanes globisporus]